MCNDCYKASRLILHYQLLLQIHRIDRHLVLGIEEEEAGYVDLSVHSRRRELIVPV